MTRYGLYSLKTTTSRRAYLIVIMLDRDAAELHADALCAQMGYAAVLIRASAYDDLPQSIAA